MGNIGDSIFIRDSETVQGSEVDWTEGDLKKVNEFRNKLAVALSKFNETSKGSEVDLLKTAIWISGRALSWGRFYQESLHVKKNGPTVLIQIVQSKRLNSHVYYQWLRDNLIPYIVMEGVEGEEKLIKIFEELIDGIKNRYFHMWGERSLHGQSELQPSILSAEQGADPGAETKDGAASAGEAS